MMYIMQCHNIGINKKRVVFCLVILVLLWAGFQWLAHRQGDSDEYSASQGALLYGNGVSSESLMVGQEENIFLNERTKVKIAYTQNDLDENHNRWVKGNLALVVHVPVQQQNTKKCEMEYTVLRTNFCLQYQPDTLEILSFDVTSESGTPHGELLEQTTHLNVSNYIVYDMPLQGEHSVQFINYQWGIGMVYCWRYEMILREDGTVKFSLFPGKEEIISQ